MACQSLVNMLLVDERIVLKRLETFHTNELFKVINRNRIYLREWLPWVDNIKSPEDSLYFIQVQSALHEESKEITFEIFIDDQVTGCISTHAIDWQNNKTSLGYWIGKENSNKGVIHQCSQKMLAYLFNSLEINRVEIRCATSNYPSRRIAEKLGMKAEGITRQSEWIYDHFVDHIIYCSLSEEYRHTRV